MSLKAFLARELTLSLRIRNVLVHRNYASISDSAKNEQIDLSAVDSQPKFEDESLLNAEQLQILRNKSRLQPQHRNILNGLRPYDNFDTSIHHNTLKYRRRLLGRYGIEGSGVAPGVAWPTKEEIAIQREYERVAFPNTIQECWAILAANKKAEEERIQAREDDIVSNLAKTAQWEKELNAKIAKKEAELKAVKEQKERLVEEVRRHFGFKVDPREEKFKAMLEMKEKEEKKRRKEAKKKERADRMMGKLLETKSSENGGSLGAQKKDLKKTELPTELA